MKLLKKLIFLFIFSLFLYDFLSSLSSFFILLSSSESSHFPFFFPFFFFLSLSLCLSISLSLLFSPPRPLPLRSAVAVEFGLTNEVNWWRSHVSFGSFFFFFFFSFFGCGFHVIVGGGGVWLIPCDLGCINGVDSSLHFFFLIVLC